LNILTIVENIKYSLILVDVKTKKEFAEGSVKGAINIPLDQIKRRTER